jgi:membrane fusion protein, copper/silver efflux system
MKKALSAVVILLLMILSYALGRRHTGPPAMASTRGRRVLYWVDPMHPQYKSDHPGIAPDCGMPLEPVYADDVRNTSHGPLTASLGQLPPEDVSIDDATQRLMGIRTATVERSGGIRVIRALGRVVPEDTRVYRINSGTDGFIRETYNDSVGSLVKKDQKLAIYYGPEFLAIASGFLAATERVPGSTGKDGSRTIPFPGAVSKQGVSSLHGYTDRLRNLGMSDVQIREIAESRQLPESIDVVAPADGFILARNITAGQHFDRSMEFYRIADLSQVWILADISGGEAQYFRPGALARISLPDQDKTFSARVSHVLPQVDASTRTLKLRLVAENPALALRADMFVNVELQASVPPGLTVPLDAVLDSGRQQRVFVERANGVFEPREVQTGWHLGGRVEIVHGLDEGERVVAAGTFLVDSESRLKNVGQAPSRQPDLHEEAPARSNTEAMAVRADKVNE